MPLCPFHFGVSLLKLKSRKKGALTDNGVTGEPRLLLAKDSGFYGLGSRVPADQRLRA